MFLREISKLFSYLICSRICPKYTKYFVLLPYFYYKNSSYSASTNLQGLVTQVYPASLGLVGKCCDGPADSRENGPQLNICIRTMVCKHHASSQGSRPASRIEQHAIANEIVTGGQGWVWPADRSVAQDLQNGKVEGVFSPSMHVHVYLHDRVPRLSSLRDEDLTLSPESYSVEGTIGRKQIIELELEPLRARHPLAWSLWS
jgi:hypothetical protein